MKVKGKATGRKIELYSSYGIYQRSGTELVTCGNKSMKFPFQHPHLTTILHIKVLLLLMDILAEAEGLNRAKQYNLLGFFRIVFACLTIFFFFVGNKIE